MEKEAKAIVDPKTAAEEAPIAVQPAVPVQAAVEAPAAGGRVISGPKYIPEGWDPDDSEDKYVYVAPENPYDTSIIDTAEEVTRVFSPSPVLPSSVCSDRKSVV